MDNKQPCPMRVIFLSYFCFILNISRCNHFILNINDKFLGQFLYVMISFDEQNKKNFRTDQTPIINQTL